VATTAKTNPPLAVAINATVRKVLEEHLGGRKTCSIAASAVPTAYDLFHSAQVEELKAQIVHAGQRLWQREYVDGNGGNISARITDELVLCTPTLCSKGQLQEQDLSIVDLENRQVFGERPQTSEILLHLEIYKTVPQALAVIHCHPPYATAHAVAGVIPQGNLIPEQEVFVGPVALAPYETPGTREFAETVLPFVRKHNTILLANHGIVCWADSVAHAGWFVEIVEAYCKTIMIASQLRNPLPEIPPEKILELLAIKKGLGLPDARLPDVDAEIGCGPRQNAKPKHKLCLPDCSPQIAGTDREDLAAALTAEIMRVLEERA
jgi:L-fuculose-phosphate aldolase